MAELKKFVENKKRITKEDAKKEIKNNIMILESCYFKYSKLESKIEFLQLNIPPIHDNLITKFVEDIFSKLEDEKLKNSNYNIFTSVLKQLQKKGMTKKVPKFDEMIEEKKKVSAEYKKMELIKKHFM